ncbi:MAG TPA: IS200/IS605 family transposase [Candidatus Angelobacter sp.]|nr:IS200/IS605 family transposase [Candidatus Angelobacter sp.]
MSHTYTKNHFHIVFSTKGRKKLISKRTQPELWAYMAGICKNVGIWVHVIGGIEDHIHALIELPIGIPVPKAVNLLKSNSSRFINKRGGFAWQEGYACFTVSASNIASVARYVRNQETHHRKMTYEDEIYALLKKHGVEFDPKYVLG